MSGLTLGLYCLIYMVYIKEVKVKKAAKAFIGTVTWYLENYLMSHKIL